MEDRDEQLTKLFLEDMSQCVNMANRSVGRGPQDLSTFLEETVVTVEETVVAATTVLFERLLNNK